MIQPYADRPIDELRRRIPWLQLLAWVFLVGVSWAKLDSLAQTARDVETTYVRRDVLNVELRLLGEKIDSQSERLRQLESQISRLRTELRTER